MFRTTTITSLTLNKRKQWLNASLRNDTEFMVSGTTGSRTAEPETAASRTKDHHGTIESRTKAVSENSAYHKLVGPATKTVIPETFSYYAKTMSGTFRNNSNTELHRVSNSKAVTESSESNNITVEYNSLNRYDEIPPIEGNLQICTKIKVATTESVEINNNIEATKRDMEKRKSTNSIDDEPKRARIDDKCTLCGKSIDNEEFTKHYQKQHGMHHEIQHNNRNFENKIQDLDRRLHDTHKNNTNNEQKKKITDDSKKRTTARSSSEPNEDTKQIVANSTLVIVTDSDVAKKLGCKKKRTSTRSDSAPIGLIEQTSSSPTLKRETNHITDLDSFVIDLTEDNNIGESKPCTEITVTKCSPKTADDDQILNDSQFIYPSDDTSLYEIPDEKGTKIAEALLLENVKDEKAANNHFDSDIEVISDVIPALSNSNKPSGTESHTTANQSSDQIVEGIDQRDSLKIQNVSEEIVSESSERGIRVVPRSPISNTKIKDETFGNLSDLGTASHSQASKPKTFSNITTVMSSGNPLIRTEAASERAENCIRYNLGNSGTIIKKLVHSGNNSKDVPAISLKRAQNKQKVEQRDSEKQINKPTRQTPYEKPNKTSSYTDKIINGPTATNATKLPKVSMLNATTTITTQPIKTNKWLHFAENNSLNNHKLNINNASTGTILTRLTPEVSVSSPNSTNVTSKVLNEAAIQPNSARQLTSNTNNNANKLKTTFPGLSITVNESKDSVPSSSISISLPHSTTITPIPVTQIASQSSVGKHNTNASTDVAQLSTSLRPMPNTQVSPNITTSLLVHSALKQQSLPHKLPIFYKPKLNAVTQRTSKRASNSASVLLPSRHSNTKPREQLLTQENPANVQNAQIQQPGLPVIKSTHRGPVSSISHSRDFSRNTENILPSNTNPTPSTSRSTPKQHPSTPVQANTSVFQNTLATAAPGYFTQSYYRKKSNTAVNVQSPQTRWYSPFLVDAHRVDASTRELNTFSSNIASRNRNANRSSTAVNTHIAHPQTHSWHTPVEPQNAQSVAERTLSNSNRSIINQRPTNSQRINTTHSSSNSRQPYLFPRQPSRLLDQRPRSIQNGLTWHTPVREPRTNN
ncbi:mucin-3A-like isoform X2 [Cydia pomonella]|uniref:mucin-3A-like isoform X2 n=1 Tax=Cydia pomonella TaxID=82600 RepID=UPI002ADD4B00|nr:mucin-3A-like isoform X2 [Cydia pomonella]XP_061727453.1 mucin-3A-like isoform X2 [Cydia pomonella]